MLLSLIMMSQVFLCEELRSSSTFLSLFTSLSLSRSRSLDLSLSLCFFDFFFDFPCREGRPDRFWDPSRPPRAGDVVPGPPVCVVERGANDGGWLNLSATAASWLSQSRPLESLLTSESGSKGRGISSAGNWEVEDVSPPAWELEESFPLEELSLPLTSPDDLLARCDILGFLLARGSMKSAAGRFCWMEDRL